MPYMEDDLPRTARRDNQLVQASVDDLNIACACLNKRISVLNKDVEEYGYLSEDTYCYDIPVNK